MPPMSLPSCQVGDVLRIGLAGGDSLRVDARRQPLQDRQVLDFDRGENVREPQHVSDRERRLAQSQFDRIGRSGPDSSASGSSASSKNRSRLNDATVNSPAFGSGTGVAA